MPVANLHTRLMQSVRGKATNYHCAYCGQPAESWDHVVPLSLGGRNEPGNMVPACKRCNGRKGARTADEFRAEMSRHVAALGTSIVPVNGVPFPCPACRQSVYLVHERGGLRNVRRKGEPRTAHDCAGFDRGYARR